MSVFASLREVLQTYLSNDQIAEIYKAYLFASRAHKKQQRSSGELYITHPVAVAIILAQIHMDPQSIIAALLHDVLEDTACQKEIIASKFGEEVAELVEGLTKLELIKFESRAEAQAENFRKMMMAMARDIRVILIKLADRLHNMRTLQHLAPERRRRIATETLEIFAPIANRLGINIFRLEFEEHGFAMLYPLRYRILDEAVRKARGHRKGIIDNIENTLNLALTKADIKNYRVWGRQKHLYSIYKKMREKRLRFSEIMDFYAFRIVVDSIDDCYRILGIVHNLYKPIPKRFKDYIAIPKTNGYQSLHTVLFGPYGVPLEIQIRTEGMDRMAENGIAAHWLYKSDENVATQAQLRANEWIKGLLEIQQSAGNSLEFIEHVKIDLFPDEVYVFTPKGDIMKLPSGSTPVDFAYTVHSDVGNSCVAAKVDRRLAPLSTRLRNGQTVEIVTAPGARPNPAWLNFVATGKARGSIRHFLKHQQREESISLGKRMVEQSLVNLRATLETIPSENIRALLEFYKFSQLDDLFAEVGLGNQVAQIVARRLLNKGEYQIENLLTYKQTESLPIKGTEGMVVTFAKCCHPIPGDPIGGVLMPGKGIVVHHETCKDLDEFRRQPEKFIPVRWEDNVQGDFEVELRIELIDGRGVYASLSLAIAAAEANIVHIHLYERSGNYSLIGVVIDVRDRYHLARVLRNIKQLHNVKKVNRLYNLPAT